MKLTEWYPGSEKPTRKGWYETDQGEGGPPSVFNWFNGRNFVCMDDAGRIHKSKSWLVIGNMDYDRWRGLAEEPK